MPRKTSPSFTDRVSDTTRSAIEGTQEKLAEYRDEVEDFVQKRPIASLAIAAGVGAVVGAAVAIGVNAMVERRNRSLLDRILDWF